jgi:DeoR/GlpR family transcriptional regulator of sugar metabolism
MMLTTQRRALISARLSRDGEIVAKRLADELQLSEDTIRRDLREMAAEGLLKRVHGGALPDARQPGSSHRGKRSFSMAAQATPKSPERFRARCG